MKIRTVSLLALLFAFWAPTVSAQDRASARRATTQPDEADVLVGAVRAISRMHMESFSDSVLWEAAIDGMIEALDDPYAEVFTPTESNT